MNILITGPTGYVGTRLCRVLSDEGHSLSGTSRDPSTAAAAIPSLDRVFAWKPLDEPISEEALDGADVIVHLVGSHLEGRLTAKKYEASLSNHAIANRNLVEGIASAKSKPETLVSIAGADVYGDRGDEESTESTELGTGWTIGLSLAVERAAEGAKEHGVEVTVIRMPIVIGPGKGAVALDAILPMFKLGLGGRLGSGRQWVPWGHVDDAVGIIAHAIDKKLRGPVNATSPEPVRQAEFARTIGKMIRRPTLLPTPAFMVRRMFGPDLAEGFLASMRVKPQKALESGYEFKFPTLEAAMRDSLA